MFVDLGATTKKTNAPMPQLAVKWSGSSAKDISEGQTVLEEDMSFKEGKGKFQACPIFFGFVSKSQGQKSGLEDRHRIKVPLSRCLTIHSGQQYVLFFQDMPIF